jgi:hypothetical protein
LEDQQTDDAVRQELPADFPERFSKQLLDHAKQLAKSSIPE